MVFHVQPLFYYDSYTQEITRNVPVTRPYTDLSSPSHILCGNGLAELASRTAKLAAAPFRFVAQRRRKRRKLSDLELLIAEPCFEKLRRFSLQELEAATDGFGGRNKIGKGGFGPVYKGTLVDGFAVAIKRRSSTSRQGVDEFRRELEVSINMAMHRNVLQVYGYCITSKEALLVYPFIANGSLHSFLSTPLQSPESQPHNLSWPARKKIVLGIAKGMAYLHESCRRRIIHSDLKPSNILLGDNFEPLISDFGIACFVSGPSELQVPNPTAGTIHESDDTNRFMGTMGYIAPECYLKRKCSVKTDVYAFGITILQLACGRPTAFSLPVPIGGECFFLRDWVIDLVRADQLELAVDPNLQGWPLVEDEVQNLIKLGLLCACDRPELRPKMTGVVSMLEGTSIIEGCDEFQQEVERLRGKNNQDFWRLRGNNSQDFDLESYVSQCDLSGPR